MSNVHKQKVYAYIIKEKKLLIFRHQFPEAGLQVPGGSVEEGEPLEEAVLREATEETGLQGLAIREYLGETRYAFWHKGQEGLHERHYYWLDLPGSAKETWLSYEWNPSDGSPAPIEFEFFWVGLDTVPELTADMDEMLTKLREVMK